VKITFTVLAALFLVVFSSCSDEGNIDGALHKAKAEGKIVMLELGSVGCIPCEQMKPVMQKLRDTHQGKLEVIFVDIRENSKTGRRFRVVMMPTQVFLDNNGKEFHRHVGFYSYEEIESVLKKAGV